MHQRPKCRSENFATVGRKHKSKSLWPWIKQWLPRYHTNTIGNKKIDKLDFIKILKICAPMDTYQEIEKTIHRMGVIFAILMSDKGLGFRVY